MDERTYTETIELLNNVERIHTTIAMTSPTTGRTAKVPASRVDERLAAGWTVAK